MLNVENEYGWVGCDLNYKVWLRDLIISHLGTDVLLFTNDGAVENAIKCGLIEGAIPTIDFAPGSQIEADSAIQMLRKYYPKGPLVNSENYPGWFDLNGKPHSTKNAQVYAAQLDYLLVRGVNVNIYMYYGGTSFGFGSGAGMENGIYYSNPTSYDYDAPLSEAGDPTDKYFAVKNEISKYLVVPEENAAISSKGKYGKLILEPLVAILDSAMLNFISPSPKTSLIPQTFEQLQTGAGFILYETIVNFVTSDPELLRVPELHDRAYVYINEDLAGILSRTERISSLPIFIKKGQKLQILVENQGRLSGGPQMGENKGIGSDVRLGPHTLGGWTMYSLGEIIHNQTVFETMSHLSFMNISVDAFAQPRNSAMTFLAKFTLGTKTKPNPLDTFILLKNWRKGMIWINGFNLGRYWPVMGPQQTLYLPAPLLKPYPQINTLVLLELEAVPNLCFETPTESLLLLASGSNNWKSQTNCFIEFTDTPILDGPTPY